jgi:thiamine biosynthesis lipoprotein ApbE
VGGAGGGGGGDDDGIVGIDGSVAAAAMRRTLGLRRELCELVLRGEAVSTSGDLEQFIEIDGVRHSHIIDPRTGRALRERTAACVRGPDGATCDALATALCVAGARDAAGLMGAFPATARA